MMVVELPELLDAKCARRGAPQVREERRGEETPEAESSCAVIRAESRAGRKCVNPRSSPQGRRRSGMLLASLHSSAGLARIALRRGAPRRNDRRMRDRRGSSTRRNPLPGSATARRLADGGHRWRERRDPSGDRQPGRLRPHPDAAGDARRPGATGATRPLGRGADAPVTSDAAGDGGDASDAPTRPSNRTRAATATRNAGRCERERTRAGDDGGLDGGDASDAADAGDAPGRRRRRRVHGAHVLPRRRRRRHGEHHGQADGMHQAGGLRDDHGRLQRRGSPR